MRIAIKERGSIKSGLVLQEFQLFVIICFYACGTLNVFYVLVQFDVTILKYSDSLQCIDGSNDTS